MIEIKEEVIRRKMTFTIGADRASADFPLAGSGAGIHVSLTYPNLGVGITLEQYQVLLNELVGALRQKLLDYQDGLHGKLAVLDAAMTEPVKDGDTAAGGK